jgi:hypothetical protein
LPRACPLAAPVPDLPRDHEVLLVILDGAADLAEVRIGEAKIAQRASLAAPAAGLLGQRRP